MLVSGVLIGIAAGVAFGGNWRRLATLTINWWPVLVVAAALRASALIFPRVDLLVYVLGLLGVGATAAANGRIAGASLIAVGTFSNLTVVLLNHGMPYDAGAATAIGAGIPDDTLHVPLTADSQLTFLADVIPFGVGRAVFSIGDFLVAFGGFLIPFIWLQEAPDSGSRSVRSANFAFFWLAQVVSKFGDPITLVALTFITYRSTQSAFLTALAVAVATIPNALFGFFGGAVADSVGARRAMFWCDVVRAVIVGVIPLLLAVQAPLSVIFAMAFLAGIGGAIFAPARGAVVATLVPREELARGNSLVYASDRAVEIGGALAGGVLVAAIGQDAFYVDALTFVVSAVLLARIALRETTGPLAWSKIRRDALEGVMFIRRSSVLWANTVYSLLAQFSVPVVNTLTPVFLTRRFAGNDAASGAALYGASEAAIALGAVIGSAVLPTYVRRLRKGRALIVGFTATGLTIALIAISPSIPSVIALFAVLGFANVVFFVPNVTITQENTPRELMARVYGARIALTYLSFLPIIFLGGAIADTIGVETFLVLAGLVTVVSALAGLFLPSIRDVP